MELWLPIEDFEGFYEISNRGRVRGLVRGKIKKQSLNVRGYKTVVLSKNGHYQTYLVHRLLALAFIPPVREKLLINHINNVKRDNRLANLEWVTHAENCRKYHALKNTWRC